MRDKWSATPEEGPWAPVTVSDPSVLKSGRWMPAAVIVTPAGGVAVEPAGRAART